MVIAPSNPRSSRLKPPHSAEESCRDLPPAQPVGGRQCVRCGWQTSVSDNALLHRFRVPEAVVVLGDEVASQKQSATALSLTGCWLGQFETWVDAVL